MKFKNTPEVQSELNQTFKNELFRKFSKTQNEIKNYIKIIYCYLTPLALF